MGENCEIEKCWGNWGWRVVVLAWSDICNPHPLGIVSIFLCFGIFLSQMGTLGKVCRDLSEDACRGLVGIIRETFLVGQVCQSKYSLEAGPCCRHKCSCWEVASHRRIEEDDGNYLWEVRKGNNNGYNRYIGDGGIIWLRDEGNTRMGYLLASWAEGKE